MRIHPPRVKKKLLKHFFVKIFRYKIGQDLNRTVRTNSVARKSFKPSARGGFDTKRSL